MASELLLVKFGRGLRTLILHRCAEHLEECFLAAMNATIAAIEDGTVAEDSQLPALIHRTFKLVSSNFPKNMPVIDAGPESTPALKAVVDKLRKHLTIFTPLQREAMSRYLRGQTPTQICLDLGLDPDLFQVIKNHFMFEAKFSVMESKWAMRQAGFVEEKTTFTIAAV